MKSSIRVRLNRIWSFILIVQVIWLCCACSACAPADTGETAETSVLTEETEAKTASVYSEGFNRADWLRDMMYRLGMTVAGELSWDDYEAIFRTAYEKGLIDDPAPCPDIPLTREYTALTVTRALGYETRTAAAADLSADDSAMMTVVYYGYFQPDDSGRVYPQAEVTDEEYTALMIQLQRWRILHGKRLLSFGDSIMYGQGNNGEGVSDMLGQKYGMTVSDYAVSGATFGVYQENSHIPDQVESAAWYGEQPDLILINGATNDMRTLARGKITDGYDPDLFDTAKFAGGMEYAFWQLRLYWPNVPVIYIRAHDMDCCDDATERLYGEYALKIAAKWEVSCVDIYQDTDFDTEDPELRDSYTQYIPKKKLGDSIHPNAAGYARYYLPLVGEKAAELIN